MICVFERAESSYILANEIENEISNVFFFMLIGKKCLLSNNDNWITILSSPKTELNLNLGDSNLLGDKFPIFILF